MADALINNTIGPGTVPTSSVNGSFSVPQTVTPLPSSVSSSAPFSAIASQPANLQGSLASTPIPAVNTTAPVTYAQQAAASLAALNTPSQAETDRSSALSKLLESMTSDENKAADTAAFNESKGVNTANKTVQDLTSQIFANNAAQASDKLSIGQNVGGIVSADRTNSENEIDRTRAIKNLNLTAQLQAAQGNLAVAKDLVSQAVDAKYAPLETRIANIKTFLDLNATDLSRADAKALNAQKTLLDAKQKDLAETKDNEKQVRMIAAAAGGNGAPASVIEAITNAKDPTTATKLAAGWFQDPLDAAYKRAQIAKIQNEISTSGANTDPGQVLAFAQQYAATGQIPSDLPKGSFGLVARTAAELPKHNGQIVDNNTGVTSSKLTSGQIDGITALYDLNNKVKQIQSLYDNSRGGNISSIGQAYNNQVAYTQLTSEFADLLGRARSGAAISAEELASYKTKLPTLNNFAGGETKFNSLLSSINGKLDSQLKNNGVSMYGYSKINVGGNDYTIGQVIQNDSGQSARINPDGSLTYLTQ